MSLMTEQDSKAGKSMDMRGWLVLAVCVAFAVVAIALTRGGDSKTGDASGAKGACQEFVKNRLKSPGTAKFSNETATSGDTWTVTGSVDSQNTFGGVVRNTYNCRTIFSGDDKWRLEALEMSGN